jgi:hypothetical protein
MADDKMTEEEAVSVLASFGATVQSDNPILTESTELDAEATKPAISIPSLEERLRAAPATFKAGTNPIDPETGKPKRGRPRKAAAEKAPAKPRVVGTPSKPIKPDEIDTRTPQEKAEAIRARADELTSRVADTINDNLMLLLTSMGVPSALLYKPGMEPKVTQTANKFTPLGNQIAMSAQQADVIGHFLAHLEQTDQGQRVTSFTGQGKLPLVMYGLLSVGAVVQYTQGLAKMYNTLQPYLEQYKAQQLAQQTNEQRNQEQEQQSNPEGRQVIR